MSDFIARNKPDWDELEMLVHRARKHLRQMTPEELSRIDVLYRRTTVNLAQVSSRTTDARLVEYLNGLTAAAHSLIYLPPQRSMWQGALSFVVAGFGRAIARTWRYHVASAVLLLGGAGLAFYLCSHDTVAAYALSMPGDTRTPGSSREQLEQYLTYGRDQQGGTKFLFASFLFQHNLKVGFLALGAGMLAAVPTVVLMVLNGMYLGAFAALHHNAGLATQMWAWILPHGITEIGAIVLCGGVGLLLGRSVVSHGRLTRRESLLRAGREAISICLGVGGMLAAAAVIESYLRQSHLSTEARFAFAAGTALFWTAYIANGFFRERTAAINPDDARAAPGTD